MNRWCWSPRVNTSRPNMEETILVRTNRLHVIQISHKISVDAAVEPRFWEAGAWVNQEFIGDKSLKRWYIEKMYCLNAKWRPLNVWFGFLDSNICNKKRPGGRIQDTPLIKYSLGPATSVIFINGSFPWDIHLLICLLVRHNASCVVVFVMVEL